MTPTDKDFWFVPLGGCGEIGMNLNLYGHADQWLMIDCGVTFEKAPNGGNRVEMPDPLFIANRSERLLGLIATHAHEDHIGAIAHLWGQLRCPVYATPFTRQVLLRKLRQLGVDAPVYTINPGDTLSLGEFTVRLLPITHSTPETCALFIETPVGRVLHTADWKLDPAPVSGPAIDPGLFRSLARQGIDSIVCDSTNAPQAGHSLSEAELFEDLLKLVRSSSGRVVVSCFASNIARLQTLGYVAHMAGRHLGLLGRSLHNMTQCARAAGYLQEHFRPVSTFELGYLPRHEILLVATGSQGESGAALQRMAAGNHPDMQLEPGDMVIFSAKTIPGNEVEVARLIQTLKAMQVQVVHADESDLALHASGHPYADELAEMYRWVLPRIAIPVHGEPRHMRCNAKIAKAAGVPFQLEGRNGDCFDLLNATVKRTAVPTGRLWLDERKRELNKVEEIC
ncbi:ribonuclease J [Pseudohongiella spirulinae]|uniref:Metallo-beta-lactamase family protein n=1 Tax=Pseudohongiella spirulinae TaxID=1249552 RepID=A0A0S2KHH5_9GAMM|nr:ribonuclease J [Pseudohongiella spirulinae]ALO47476.1 Metallo-beta-lactamase family protein [Pseudohongiella spirulinae]